MQKYRLENIKNRVINKGGGITLIRTGITLIRITITLIRKPFLETYTSIEF